MFSGPQRVVLINKYTVLTILVKVPMRVIKRDGNTEAVSFDKITERLENLCVAHSIKCSYVLVAQKTIAGVHDGIHTSELDTLAAEHAAYMCIHSGEYGRLAKALLVSNLHKKTGTFTNTFEILHKERILDTHAWDFFAKNKDALESMIDYKQDYEYDYSGVKALAHILLLRVNGKVVERPQSMHMRIAVGLYAPRDGYSPTNPLEDIKECYEMFRDRKAIHGTPTSMNACVSNKLTSCFLQCADGTKRGIDSVYSMYETVSDTAAISYSAGGQSIAVSGLQSGSMLEYLKVVEACSNHVKKIEGRRKSAVSVYIEPWHADIRQFIDLKLPSKQVDATCRDLFLALWVCDLFMRRVEAKGEWSLFNPATAPGLDACFGEEFEKLYVKYEQEGRAVTKVCAVTLWYAIMNNIIESGVPYVLYKDACNRLSNQQHRGCIKSSNLCTEIIQYSSPEETAVCNLASVSLPAFIVGSTFDHDALYKTVYRLTKNLDRVVDLSVYDSPKARLSNSLNRAIGIGDSGFADMCMELMIPHTSAQARKLNLEITETMYYAFLRASCDLAKEKGTTYPTYEGSLVHKGILNFDLYSHTPTDRWPFSELRKNIAQHGIRHSLGICGMPTSTGSQVLGNNESREPYISNLFVRGVLSGTYMIVNRHLERELTKLGLYTYDIKKKLIEAEGSVQGIEEIPEHVREVFKTVWEVKCSSIIDMVADTMIYTDQSRSMSLFFDVVTKERLTSALFHGWKRGIKTGMYYLRTKAPLNAPPMALECLMCSS